MKLQLTGRNTDRIGAVLNAFDCVEITDDSPELIVVHGGDGALLGAEREFPGIPKLPFRTSASVPLCPVHSSFADLFQCYLDGVLAKTELMKLAGAAPGARQLVGINDVFIHNLDRVGAIRYRVWIDGHPYGHEIIGDGVGVATVHGSTAYYRSITHSIFKIGIGLAFSNSTEVTNHLVLPDDTEIMVEITRGPAVMVADNSPEACTLAEGDRVKITKIPETAVVYGLNEFMCDACRRLRHGKDYGHE